MGKRKLGHESNPVDLASPNPKVPIDVIKHRTCWLHVLAYLRAHKMKMSRQRIRRLQLTAPCLLGTSNFPRRKRSERGVKCKIAISKQKKKLNSGEFECYLENLWRSFSEDKKTCFTCLDSLWFNLYLKKSSRANVLTWIKKKHIFSKKYVLVPIVCWGHWSLLIFCHFNENLHSNTKTPCMLLLDSLEMANPRRLEADIRKCVNYFCSFFKLALSSVYESNRVFNMYYLSSRFVFDIYKADDRPETRELISKIPLLVPKVPQQTNGEECGNFVLYFINLFVEGAPENFSIDSYPYFMDKNWFSPEGFGSFCERLESIPLESALH
ncbi:hypothetical protein Dsin_005028 [Dipteronia sinensis]|uniref:Ubiquitin-like protease family profile domain-containing protein n=1 Tax=Dipteronia sinensis TaxID=43782 RepID=A0AAE0AVQ1_9ROSI|nr:hypothetical protein Dsin_005028 [Dipteronia sinensis]